MTSDEQGMIRQSRTKREKKSDLEKRLIDFAVRIIHLANTL